MLFICLAFTGAVAAGAVGGMFFVPRSAGLAGGAMVLAWALGGAVVLPVSGLFVCRRLDTTALRRVCTITGGIAVVLAGLLTWRARQVNDRLRDPGHLYDGIPEYSLSLRQLKIKDPYLSTRTDLDAQRRSWATVLPDKRTCRGEMPAAYQRQVAEMLSTVEALGPDALAECRRSDEQAEQLISWTLSGGSPRELRIFPACLQSRSEIAALIHTVRGVSMANKSRVRCR